MGLFWDLYQQSQISEQREHAASIEQRLVHMEDELRRMQELLRAVIGRLEQHVGADLDQDGKVG